MSNEAHSIVTPSAYDLGPGHNRRQIEERRKAHGNNL